MGEGRGMVEGKEISIGSHQSPSTAFMTSGQHHIIRCLTHPG